MLGTRGSGACQLSLAALWPNENVAASPRAAPRPCGAVDRAGRHPGCRTPSSTGSRALLEGAAANGFTGELWTLERIALVIERLTRVQLNWKKASMAAALCYGVRGGGAQLAFHVTAGDYNTDTLIQVLGELRRFLGGEKATLLWDGLPAHRSRAMRAWLVTQRHWLVTERLPAYAPELNPVEGLWSSLKAVELANLTSPTLAEVIDQAHRGIDRVRRTPYLPYSFLQHTGLSVS